MRNWLNSLSHLPRKLRRARYEKNLARLKARRLFLESLEDRRMMTTTVSLELEDDEALEGSLSNRAMLSITRETDDDSEPLTVGLSFASYTVTGIDFVVEDESGVPLENQNAVTFAAAQTQIDVYVRAVGDTDNEGDETLDVGLVADTGDPPAFGLGNSNQAAITLLDNRSPTADNDTFEIPQGGNLSSQSVLANDSDPDDDALTATLVSSTSYGSLSLATDGSVSYAPYSSTWYGTDTFTYTITDGLFTTSAATATIRVNGTPIAGGSFTTDEDVTYHGTVAGNGVDPEGDTLTVTLTSGVSHGNLTFNSDGTYSYAPEANYNGSDSFSYSVTDGWTTASGSIAITVNAVNDPPVANDDTLVVDEDSSFWNYSWTFLANDSDVDTDYSWWHLNVVSPPQHGQVSFGGGNYTVNLGYTPDSNFNGTDSFTYRVWDGQAYSNIATVTITVNPVNDSPVFPNSTYSYSTPEDTASGVLFGSLPATDPDAGTTLAYSLSGTGSELFAVDSDGQIAVANGAALNYETTTSYWLSVAVTDGSAWAYSNVAITVTNVNETPVFSPTTYQFWLDENGPAGMQVGAVSATDPDAGTSLTYSITGGTGAALFAVDSSGQLTVANGAALDYEAANSLTLVIQATDGVFTTEAQVAINLNNVNEVPVFTPASYGFSIAEMSPAGTAVGAVSASDPEGVTPSFSITGGSGVGLFAIDANGQLSVAGGAVLDYEATNSYSLTVAASDGTFVTDAVVTVNLIDVIENRPPVFDPDEYQFVLDENDTGPLAVGDVTATDPDYGNTLTYAITAGDPDGLFTIDSSGQIGLASGVSLDHEITPTYTLTVRVSDGALTDEATVEIIVDDVFENSPPVAGDDAYSVPYLPASGQSVLTIANPGVLANDSDPDGDAIQVILLSGASHGSLTWSPSGGFTYTAVGSYSGLDHFSYRVFDGEFYSNTATVTLNVTGDAPPVFSAASYSFAVAENSSAETAVGTVAATDADLDPLTFAIVAGNSADYFTIDQQSGAIKVAEGAQLDYETTTSYELTVRASDGILPVTATVQISITNLIENAPPLFDPTSYSFSVAENSQLGISVGAVSATDPEGQSLTYTIVSGNAAGYFTIGGTTGQITVESGAQLDYETTASYTLTVQASDGVFASTASVQIALTDVSENRAPTAAADAYQLAEDGVLTVSAVAGVLANDADPDEDLILASLVSSPAHGTLTLNPNGSFVYTPDANFYGTDSFTYQTGDGSDTSSVATVTITVTPVNDAPVAVNDQPALNEDQTLTIAGSGVLGNDTDVDGDNLTASLIAGPAHGTLDFQTSGGFVYTPAANYSGSDSFTYQTSDGISNSNTATVTITVNPVNDAPVAAADALTASEDTALEIPVAALVGNDTDLDGDSLTVSIASAPVHGSLTQNPDGSYSYLPTANYYGSDSFAYQASDGVASSNVVTVSVIVSAVNDVPVVIDQAFSVNQGGTLEIAAAGVLAGSSDVEGSSLSAVVTAGPSHGTLTLAADGSFTYVPAAGYFGSDGFTYQATDGAALSSIATVTLTVVPPNIAPVTANDSYSTLEDTPLAISAGVLGNDSDPNGDPLVASIVAGPAHGSLTLEADGSFVYTPEANYAGTDSFSYAATDPSGGANSAVVLLTIVPVNDAPIATDNSYGVNEDESLTLAAPGVLSGDSDVDGDTLTITLVTAPEHGTLTLQADGAFSYTPEANYYGSDSFTYSATDPSGVATSATVNINVAAVNDAPVAADNTYQVDEDGSLSVSGPGVLAGDSDIEQSPLTVTLVSGTAHGSLTLNSDGSFSYAPQANYAGLDSFSYQASDGTASSAPATVTIIVHPLNDAPVAVGESYSVNEGETLTVFAPGVLVGDSDVDGDSLTAAIYSSPAHGTLNLNSDGSFTYTPHADYEGPDSFEYQASDGAIFAVATVAITVAHLNQAPTAAADSYSINEDQTLTVSAATGVLAGDTDPDGDSLTAVLVSAPQHGALTLQTDGSFSYVPAANYHGTDSFTYHAVDSWGLTHLASVNLTVAPASDAPVAANDSYNLTEGQTLTVDPTGVLANDSDVDGDALTTALVSGPAHGTVSLLADGSFNYTPAAHYFGTDSFTYQTSDGQFTTSDASVTLVIHPGTQPHVAVIGLRLANDTGASSSDQVTTDPTLTGTVEGDFILGGTVEVEFDHNSDSDREGYVVVALPGDSFTYNPTTLDASLVNYEGTVALRYRTVEYNGSHQVVATGTWTNFTFTLETPPAPEIEVVDSSQVSVGDGVGLVGFGIASLGSPASQTLTIRNLGESQLTIDLNSFTIPAGYSLIQPPAATVVPGGQTNFIVRLNATMPGSFLGELSFGSNDSDESPYSFQLSGQVLSEQPELAVRQANGASITSGDTLAWGTTVVGVPITRTLTISNLGSGTLTLNRNSLTLPSGLSLVTPFAASVAPYGQTTLTLRLDAQSAGSVSGMLSFTSNDADESPFSISINGLVQAGSQPGDPIEVGNLHLVNDTGHFDTDQATYDLRLSGAVIGDFDGGSVDVEFDHDADGLAEGTVSVPISGGEFLYDPVAVTPSLAVYVGALTFYYRTVARDDQGNVTTTGSWEEFAVQKLLDPAAGNLTISEFGLQHDTGSSNSDRVTIDPTVYVVVSGDLEGGSARVEFDLDGDGTVEGSLIATSNIAEYYFDPRTIDSQFGYPVGSVAISYRLVKLNGSGDVQATGGWDALHFTTEAPPTSEWIVASLGLAQDDGAEEDDFVSSDPTLTGTASGPEGSNSFGPLSASVQFDVNGDGLVDGSVPVASDGAFSYRPNLPGYGAATIQARVREWNTAYQQYLTGAWTGISIAFVPVLAPAVLDLHLVQDTGASDSDKVTRNPTIAGTIAGDPAAFLRIAYDLNGDEVPEGTVFTNGSGGFQFLPLGLAAGEHTVQVRTGRYDTLAGEIVPGPWSSFSFTYEARALPAVTGLHLVEDTGTSAQDGVTTQAQLAATLSGGEGDLANVEVEFDHNGDGVADGSTYSNDVGALEYRPLGLGAGEMTVRARAMIWDSNLHAFAYGNWTSITFTLEAPTFASSQLYEVALYAPTEEFVGLTTNPALKGKVSPGGSDNSNAYLSLEFDNDGDGDVDGRTTTNDQGEFIYVPIGLSPGTHTIRGRAKDWNYQTRTGQYGSWQTYTITLQAPQNAPPVVATLELRADSGAESDDAITANALLVGAVTNDQPGQRLVVEFDHDGDGTGEGVAYTDATGKFHYTPEPLAFGPVTIAARAIEWNGLIGQYQAGPWNSLTFEYADEASAPAYINILDMEQWVDLTALVTHHATVVGSVINAGYLAGVSVEADLDGNGTADQSALTDELGSFRLALDVTPGEVTVHFRTREVESGSGQLLYGAWSPYSFVYQIPSNAPGEIAALALSLDTGEDNSDGITTDPSLQGEISNDGAVLGLTVQFDVNGDDVIDGATTTVNSQGSFFFKPTGLSYGAQTIRARVKEYDDQSVAHYGPWQTIQFILEDPAQATGQIDALVLANDTGASSTDGATSDPTITGHVAASNPGSITVELDLNADSASDTTVTTDSAGNFSFEQSNLSAGLFTVRARVQSPTGAPPQAWTSLNFVYASDPDDTSAQGLAIAYNSFANLWQAARGDYREAINYADQLFRAQTQATQEAYDGAIGLAGEGRHTQIAAAKAAYQAVVRSAEGARNQALAAAGNQLAVELANFQGDPTSFRLQDFVWPDAPPDFALAIPQDADQPLAPSAEPLYTGTEYNFRADAPYQAALASAEYQFSQAMRAADAAQREAKDAADAAFKAASDAALAELDADNQAALEAADAVARAGTNPVNLEQLEASTNRQLGNLSARADRASLRAGLAYEAAIRAVNRSHSDQLAAIELPFTIAFNTLLNAYNQGQLQEQAFRDAHYDLTMQRSPLVAALHLWRENQLAELARAHALGEIARGSQNDAQYWQIITSRDLQWTEHDHWNRQRSIHADHVLESLRIAAQKKYDVALAEARRVQTRDLAAAAKTHEVARQTAEVKRWEDKIEAQGPSLTAWDAFEETPWSGYQKALIEGQIEYATSIAPKLIEQAEEDGQSALAEALAIADQRKSLEEDAADFRHQQRTDDNDAWRDYRLVANNKERDQGTSYATLYKLSVADHLAAGTLYSQTIALSDETYAKDVALFRHDEALVLDQAWADWFRTGGTSAAPEVAKLLALHGLTDAHAIYDRQVRLIDAQDVRGEQIAQAAKDHAVRTNLAQQERSDMLIDAYQDYQIALADHALTYAINYSGSYGEFVTVVSAADNTASHAFAAHQQSLVADDAELQSAWNTGDVEALQTLYVGASERHQEQIEAWDSSVDSPWSALQLGLAQVELDRVDSLGTKLVTYAGQSDEELAGWISDLATEEQGLAGGVADGLKEQTDALAEALDVYAGNVALARYTYAEALAQKTATHDKDITARNKQLADQLAERLRVFQNAWDQARWDGDYDIAELYLDQSLAMAETWFIEDGVARSNAQVAIYAAFNPQYNAIEVVVRQERALAERDRAIDAAGYQRSWVEDIGERHVELAEDAKAAADTLADDLKLAAHGLTSDQAEAAQDLAEALATSQKDYTDETASAQADHDDAEAGLSGTLSKGLTDVANSEREGITAERGAYETASYDEHFTKISGAGLQPAAGSLQTLTGPLADLRTYQQGIAQQDVTWSQGQSSARNQFESLTSTAYAGLANSQYGAGGSVAAHIHGAGQAAVGQTEGLAAADKRLSEDATGHLAEYTLEVQSAASKAAKGGVLAETEYDVGRAEARRTYNNLVAVAQQAHTVALAEAEYAWYSAADMGAPTVLAARDVAYATAYADLQAARKAALVVHAGLIGDAQITRAGKLGDALVTEVTEEDQAEIDYVTDANGDELAYEEAVTEAQTPAVAGSAAADQAYDLAGASEQQALTAGLGAAGVSLAQELAPVNVARGSGAATAEGNYQLAVAQRRASRLAAAASGAPAASQLAFDAAEAAAQAQWQSAMRVPYSMYVAAMTQADANVTIALMQAQETASNSRATADVALVAGSGPLDYQAQVDAASGNRGYAEEEAARQGASRLAQASVYQPLDVAYAAAARTRAVAGASADKTFWVGAFGTAEDWGNGTYLWGEEYAGLEHDRGLAYADAEVAQVTSRGTAAIDWTTDALAAERGYRTEQATGAKALRTELARIDRDLALGKAPLAETRTNAYASAQTTAWSAEVAAANTRRTNEANALAAYRSADYAQQAVAISSIDAALNLPWSVHQELLAVAKSAWWTTSEEASFLALAAVQNAADTAYQNTVNTAFALWTTTTAQAEKAFRLADAGAGYTQSAARFAADEAYEQAMALADEAWQVSTATAVSAFDVALETSWRDYVESGDGETEFADRMQAIETQETARRASAQTYTVAETGAFGTARTAVSGARQTYVNTFSSAWVSYVTATANADEAYAGTEATAAYGRVWTVATEQASRTAASASALAGAINALASTTGTPWANYDGAVAAADAVFASLVAPAQRDQILSEADAEADFTLAQAAAVRALRIAQAQSTATRDTSQADSEHDLALSAVAAEDIAAPHFAMITREAAQAAAETGRSAGGPARAWDDTEAPAASPAGPAPSLPRTPFLPAASTPTAQPAIQPISTVVPPGNYDDGHTNRNPLPAPVVEGVNPGGFFNRHFPNNYDPVRNSGRDDAAVKNDSISMPVGVMTPAVFSSPLKDNGTVFPVGVVEENPLPEGFTVNPNWTRKEIEREAWKLAGGGAGPLTADQDLEYRRLIGAITEAVLLARIQMNYGERREAMIDLILQHQPTPPGTPAAGFHGTDRFLELQLKELTYAELKTTLARRLPAGSNDVEDVVSQELARARQKEIVRATSLAARQNIAEERAVLLDLTQLALDLGGILEPTPICDIFSAGISAARIQESRWYILDVAVSVVSIIPYVGDTTKLLKIPRWISSISKAVKFAAHNPKLVETVRSLLTQVSSSLTHVPWSKIDSAQADKLHELKSALDEGIKQLDEATAIPSGVAPIKLVEVRTLTQQRELAKLTREVREELMNDFDALTKELSEPQIRALSKEPWRMQLYFGTALEGRVAARVRQEVRSNPDSVLSDITWTGKTNAPQDFIGPNQHGFDITGGSASSIRSHFARLEVNAVITYDSIPSDLGYRFIRWYNAQ